MKNFHPLLSLILLTGCSSIGSYGGKSAEEWHQKYVETYDELDSYIIMYESEVSERTRFEDELTEMQSCVYYAMPDIPYLGYSPDYNELIEALSVAIDGLTDIGDCNNY